MGVVALLISFGLLEVSSALAQEKALSASVRQAAPEQPPPDDDIIIIVDFTDPYPANVQITDLSGNVVGAGVHEGMVSCIRSVCSQETQLQFIVPVTDDDRIEYEYRFTIRQALDPVTEKAVVEGTGTETRGEQKDAFAFIATFQNNRDGTVSVRYEASKPDASFIIPNAPGMFVIQRR